MRWGTASSSQWLAASVTVMTPGLSEAPLPFSATGYRLCCIDTPIDWLEIALIFNSAQGKAWVYLFLHKTLVLRKLWQCCSKAAREHLKYLVSFFIYLSEEYHTGGDVCVKSNMFHFCLSLPSPISSKTTMYGSQIWGK